MLRILGPVIQGAKSCRLFASSTNRFHKSTHHIHAFLTLQIPTNHGFNREWRRSLDFATSHRSALETEARQDPVPLFRSHRRRKGNHLPWRSAEAEARRGSTGKPVACVFAPPLLLYFFLRHSERRHGRVSFFFCTHPGRFGIENRRQTSGNHKETGLERTLYLRKHRPQTWPK